MHEYDKLKASREDAIEYIGGLIGLYDQEGANAKASMGVDTAYSGQNSYK